MKSIPVTKINYGPYILVPVAVILLSALAAFLVYFRYFSVSYNWPTSVKCYPSQKL